ncbi:MAG: uracil phosphoribosyltransferase [Candidatus Dadabacteria bacterium]|nr:MAG: uracil phosphoribosyltransferase [Candidatus Dadabacteria bacterium]
MIVNLGEHNSLISEYMRQLRDNEIQKNRELFRDRVFKIGNIIAYEISKKLKYEPITVNTPLGQSQCHTLAEQPVVGVILRAGIPLFEGLISFFPNADACFVSAYRKHNPDGSFDIALGYRSHPALSGRVLIMCDPMLATGRSFVDVLNLVARDEEPHSIHIVSVIASKAGLEHVSKHFPEACIWTCAVDPELDAKDYIVPGLGDAGDLSYGMKLQS